MKFDEIVEQLLEHFYDASNLMQNDEGEQWSVPKIVKFAEKNKKIFNKDINKCMVKKYLTLVENYMKRFERGGFLVGDVFKFDGKFKSSDAYKSLGQNTKI